MIDRLVAPAFVEPSKIKLPDPEIINFHNGSRLFLLNVGEQPVIKVEFIFRAGSWFETTPGIAYLTGKMLVEGTVSFSSDQIAKLFDKYGAFVEIASGFDYVNFSIHIPTRHFEKVFDLIEEILFKPTFPISELELLKQIQIQQLKVNALKNKFVASRSFRSNLYPSAPYGYVMTEESLTKISTEDLRNYFEKWMAGKFECLLTGKFEKSVPEKLMSLFRNNLRELNEFLPITFQSDVHFDQYQEREGSLQSSIFIGKRTINKSDKDFPELLLLNEVFGGYFGSRLMQNIREEKGYTYSIYSHIATMKNDAYFVISSEVKKENKDQTIEEIQKEINKIKQERISKEELTQVKNYLKGSICNTLTNSFAITEKIKNIYFYNLNPDFYNVLFDQIDASNENSLLSLANETLFDQALSTFVVG